MRTVTFADPETVDRMNHDFVLVWSNQQPDLVSGAPTSPDQAQAPFSKEEARAYPVGGGGGNIRTFFCDSEGHVLYYLEGYWTPSMFQREMTFAGSLHPDTSLESSLSARHDAVVQERAALLASCENARAKPGTTEESKQVAALGLLSHTFDLTAQLLRQDIAPVLDRIQREGERRGVIS